MGADPAGSVARRVVDAERWAPHPGKSRKPASTEMCAVDRRRTGAPRLDEPGEGGAVQCREKLGGIIREYYREAA